MKVKNVKVFRTTDYYQLLGVKNLQTTISIRAEQNIYEVQAFVSYNNYVSLKIIKSFLIILKKLI